LNFEYKEKPTWKNNDFELNYGIAIYLITNFPLGNIFANRFNDSRTFKTRIRASTLRGRVSTFPLKGISSVKSSSMDSDENFIVFELRVINLLEL
jgi:hypothetical protein